MKNVQYGLVFQNLSDLVLKEIYGIYEAKNLNKEQIKKIQNDWKRNFWKVC